LHVFPTITNLSYDQVEINTPPEETIIYLDPPYFGTAEYKEKLDHDRLHERIHKQKCKVYVSSYEYNLPLVYSIEKRSLLSVWWAGQKKSENLYLFDING
jgi:site-specific DNA-adenine methylase